MSAITVGCCPPSAWNGVRDGVEYAPTCALPSVLTAIAAAAASSSACEPHRTFIEAQLRLRRNAMAIYQDLVDCHGYAGAYNSVKRFAGKLRHREPEQFDRLAFLPGEEMQVDYGEGALTRVPGTERWRKPRLFVATLRYSRRRDRKSTRLNSSHSRRSRMPSSA